MPHDQVPEWIQGDLGDQFPAGHIPFDPSRGPAEFIDQAALERQRDQQARGLTASGVSGTWPVDTSGCSCNPCRGEYANCRRAQNWTAGSSSPTGAYTHPGDIVVGVGIIVFILVTVAVVVKELFF